MSVFTSHVTEELQIPHDPGQSVIIRKLNPRQLGAAQRASQVRSVELLKELGGPAFMKELRDLDPAKVEEAAAADPLMLYDREALISRGVMSWTYNVDHKDAKIIEDLDEVTQTWLATAILKLSRPELYDQEARKNG